VSLRRLRSGEMLALAGAICLIVALALPWYENAQGKLSAWATFGVAVALLMLTAAGALALVLATVTERSTAIPVAAAVWSTLLGMIGVIAAIVRLLERPEHASEVCAGTWLALAGALLVAAGSWQSMRDERTGLYPPDATPPRKAPPAGA
jgi:peptidoglycan/LPS O-acetylase OafA/YrhL